MERDYLVTGVSWDIVCARGGVCVERGAGPLPFYLSKLAKKNQEQSQSSFSLLGLSPRRSLLMNGQFLTALILWLAKFLIRSGKFRGRRSGDSCSGGGCG